MYMSDLYPINLWVYICDQTSNWNKDCFAKIKLQTICEGMMKTPREEVDRSQGSIDYHSQDKNYHKRYLKNKKCIKYFVNELVNDLLKNELGQFRKKLVQDRERYWLTFCEYFKKFNMKN